MRQVCNVAYAYQIEAFSEPAELDAFVDNLPLPPKSDPAPRRSRVSEDLLSLMAAGSVMPATARSES